jgi:fatty-acyl-CoA synthase
MTTFRGPSIDLEAFGPLTLGGMLTDAGERYATREAVVFHGRDGVVRWTYADLLAEARTVGRALLAHGVVKGTRVAVLMGNRPEFLTATFGIALAGGVIVPISTFVEPPELDYVLRHSDTAVLLMQKGLLKHDYLHGLLSICPELEVSAPGTLRTPRFPFLRSVACLGLDAPRGGIVSLTTFLERASGTADELLDAARREVQPADDAVVIYTSGTTARPKGVLHAHRSPTLQSKRLASELCLDRDSRVWTAWPYYWTAGFSMGMGSPLSCGACLVCQEHFDAGEALELLEAERVTTPLCKAHQQTELEAHPDWDTRDLSALRHVEAFTSFGRHPRVHVDDVWSNRAAYGLTETFSSATSAPVDTAASERTGNHGWILPGNAIRILDPATGDLLDRNTEGEIAVRAVTMAKGYLKMAPEDVFDEDGFFRTGDAGFVDDQNRLHFTGRASLMIKTSGANVSPVEIENELLRHPDLRMAWVVGVPDEHRGELVVACVVPHEGVSLHEDGVRAFLKGKVASYKIPRRVLFVEEHDVALTGNGTKARADELRRLATERLQA